MSRSSLLEKPANEIRPAALEGRPGHQRARIIELERENRALRKQNKDLKALVGKLQEVKAKWELAMREFKALRKEVEKLRACGINLRARIFGRKSEKADIVLNESDIEPESGEEISKETPKERKKRGQRVGSKGHGRRLHEEIPPQVVTHELAQNERTCPVCGKVYEEMNSYESSEEIDWQVVVVRKEHRRMRYRKSCQCRSAPNFVVAPVPPKLTPKALLSVGTVARLIVEKYCFGRPTENILRFIELSCGARLAEGTVNGTMKRLRPMLLPLYDAICDRLRSASYLHSDESGWKVFEETDGKSGYSWWLWTFVCEDAAAFTVDPSRSKKVVENLLALNGNPLEQKRILSSDMYGTYTKLGGVINSFCWAHVRRHFIEASRANPKTLGSWGNDWIGRIRTLYQLYDKRTKAQEGLAEYHEAQALLIEHVKKMEIIIDEQIADPKLHGPGKEVLYMMKRHWDGLIVFVDHPQVSLDNNEAERALRTPVVGRKNFYGSGAIWGAEFAAICYSIIQTAARNGLNPLTYLEAYLNECARCTGKAPDSIERFLPWKMSDEERAKYLQAPT